MAIRPLLYPLILLLTWLLSEVGRASEPESPPNANETPQILIEMRIVNLGERTAERFRTLANFTDPRHATKKQKAPSAMLTDVQVRTWLELFQEDPATNVCQSPRLMTLNEHEAQVAIGGQIADGQFNGLKIQMLPQVARDRKQIQIRTALELSTPKFELVARRIQVQDGEETQEVEVFAKEEKLETLAFKEMLTVPAGQTVAISLGKKMVEQRTETDACPLLARIPYLSRFFRNVGYARECQETFLLVTAKLVTNKE